MRIRPARLVKIGLLLFVGGTGPLLLIIAAAELGLTSDPNPNPIGPGLLAFFTFWPSVILIIVGVVLGLIRRQDPPGVEVARGAVAAAPVAPRMSGSGEFALQSLVHGPLGRGAAAFGGVVLVLRALSGPEGLGSRAGAAALVVGAACLWFAALGRVPSWFRR